MINLSINKFNSIKIYKVMTPALVIFLGAMFAIQLFLPVSIDNNYVNKSAEEVLVNTSPLQGNTSQGNGIAKSRSFRTGLFKSAVALSGKPLADKTIERIKSQLKLQCVMTMNGKLVAYIHIDGVGLKKCAVGDSVNDIFTVLNIDKAKKCVDISIIDHKVTLYM